MDNKTESQSLNEAGLAYVALGLPIIPVCSASHSGMAQSHKDRCKSPGKTPIEEGWNTRATTTVAEFTKWYMRNKYINIGLPLGQASGLVGIDIDGEHGEEMLAQWSGGDLPDTWEFSTGNGRRLLYRIPAGMKTKKFKSAGEGAHQELAILCDGQQTVIPPSIHVNGTLYLWKTGRSPGTMTIANAPDWVLVRIVEEVEEVEVDLENEPPPLKPIVKPEEWTTPVAEGQRNNQLTKLAGSLLGRGHEPEKVLEELKKWNQKFCVPPLAEVEIEKMVSTLGAKEALKKARKKRVAANRPVFDVSSYVNRFVEEQTKKGFTWLYTTDMDCFFMCDNVKGPWIQVPNVYTQKLIRELLAEEPQNNSMHVINEITSALKHRFASLNEITFDIGTIVDTHQLDSTMQAIDLYDTFNPYNIISVQNGILHWKDNKLVPWDPKYLTTLQLPVTWDPHATCPKWEAVLQEWIPDPESIYFLQEYVGLSLIPDTSTRTAVLLYGSGANGKSLFIDTVRMLFGKALTAIPLHKLTEKFEIAYLQNKLINICGDIDAKYISETGVLKALIAGDTLRGEIKHGASFDFHPVARLIFSANTLPKVADKSAAWYSRWHFIEFPKTFAVDPNFTRNFMIDMTTELNGIFRWAIAGLHRVREQRGFTVSKAMLISRKEYQEENDNVVAFVNTCLERVPHKGGGTTLSTSAVHALYKEWVETNMSGSVAVGQIEFTKRMKALGIEKSSRNVEGKWRQSFTGIQVLPTYQTTYDYFNTNFSV